MKAIDLHNRAITIIEKIERKNRQINDFETRLEIERQKPYILSFLSVPEKWYNEQINESKEKITVLKSEYNKLILEFNPLT